MLRNIPKRAKLCASRRQALHQICNITKTNKINKYYTKHAGLTQLLWGMREEVVMVLVLMLTSKLLGMVRIILTMSFYSQAIQVKFLRMFSMFCLFYIVLVCFDCFLYVAQLVKRIAYGLHIVLLYQVYSLTFLSLYFF